MEKNEAIDKIDEIERNERNDYKLLIENYSVLGDIAEKYPELADSALNAFVNNMEVDGSVSDSFYQASKAYLKIIDKMSDKKIFQSLERLPKTKYNADLKLIPLILDEKKHLSMKVFKKLMQNTDKIDANNNYLYINGVATAIKTGTTEEAEYMLSSLLKRGKSSESILNKFFKKDKEENKDLKFLKFVAPHLNNVVRANPELSTKIIEMFEDKTFKKALGAIYSENLYNVLGEVVTNDLSKAEKAFGLYEKQLKSDENNSSSLISSYRTLEKIAGTYPELKDKSFDLIKLGLKSDANTKATTKVGYRALGDVENLKSTVFIGERTEKTDDNEHGWVVADKIDYNEVGILVLGGNATKTDQAANGYAKGVKDLLDQEGLSKDVKVYSAVYDFGDFANDSIGRSNLFEKHKHTKSKHLRAIEEIPSENIDPKYIEDLYEKAISPRISRLDGRMKLSTEEACKRMNKLRLFTHCHGAYVALKLEETMQKKMTELGYSKDDRDLIQKQMLVISHAPYAPLGVSKSTTISFGSANDWDVDHHNNFQKYLNIKRRDKDFDMNLCYLSGEKGNLFLVNKIYEDKGEEHNFAGFDISEEMTKDGKEFTSLEKKAIINGVKHSLKQEDGFEPIPETRDLVGMGKDNPRAAEFDKMEKAGDDFYKNMTTELRGILAEAKQNKSTR